MLIAFIARDCCLKGEGIPDKGFKPFFDPSSARCSASRGSKSLYCKLSIAIALIFRKTGG